MAKPMLVVGRDPILRNMNRKIMAIRSRSRAGLWSAALLVRRESQLLTPIDTGTLRGSTYTEVHDLPRGPIAEIGYGASYAVYVHEIPPPGLPPAGPAGRHARHKPPTQWKFLETALKTNAERIVQIIRAEAKKAVGA